MVFELEHTIDCSLSELERALDHPEFQQYLSRKLTAFKLRQLVNREETGAMVKTSIKCVPKIVLPRQAQRFIHPDQIEWMEESERNRETHVIRYRLIPKIWKNRFNIVADYLFSQISQRQTKRFIRGLIEVSFLGFGARIENYIFKRIALTLEEEAKIVQNFIEEYRVELNSAV